MTLKKYIKKSVLTVITILTAVTMFSQNINANKETLDFYGKYHMVSPDEMGQEKNNLKDFISTAPPLSPRSIAEFEPNQGVIVRGTIQWGQTVFGIPLHLIKSLSEHVNVYIICANQTQQNTITNSLNNAEVNMDNVEFVIAPSDSYWTRDYSPWFIEYDDKNIGIVNFPYNRPRPDDNDIPLIMGDYFDLDVFGMNMLHTGGNYMSTGYGIAASCDLVYTENEDISQQEIADMALDYLGLSNYYLVNDPLDDYIEHIDCWAKFLAPDKILITEVPNDDPRYEDFELMADFWKNQISPYGNKFKVYRTYSPDGQPYTNSLIMNNKVYVPIVTGEGSDYNDDAIQVYQEAMPGYEIIEVENNTYFGWQSTDALHCRTSQVPDFEMLRILHYPIIDTIAYQQSISIDAEIYSLSINENTTETASLYYSINDTDFQNISMANNMQNTFTADILNLNLNDKVCYYIHAQNDNNKSEKHPYIGEYNPHCFYLQEPLNILSNQNNRASLNAFPNPAKDRLTITAVNLPQGKYVMSIFDNHGSLVFSNEIIIDKNWTYEILDLTILKSGMYHIRLSNNNKSESLRFIKK
jgi:agmatine deiminase